jgi:hypothetical protein
MSTLDIQTALDTHLTTLEGLPPFQLENKRFDASSNLPSFVRSTLLPANSNVISLGIGAWKELQGIYQVDVFYPLDSGTHEARILADKIVELFPIGDRYEQGDLTVIVNIASVMAAYSINKYYCIPIRVEWGVFA